MTRRPFPRRCTDEELAPFAVSIYGWPYFLHLRCEHCNQTWNPTAASGRMKCGYWKCPHGCNTGGGPKGFRIRVAGRWFPA